jgi:NADH:ubiquinone oxidoreductase subunit B-like Fe-S oxidoreductase
MGAVLLTWLQKATTYPYWLITLGGVMIGGGVYLISVLVMKVPEVQSLIRIIKGRIAR